ncbi:MAG: glycosyltransferase family 2 protein [Actinomycetota bacterium]|nr:glycosyltransferase family 2 protein [Actinomycetota bacterium]
MTLAATYVLPLRWADTSQTEEMTRYLQRLAGEIDQIIVVDGSLSEIFEYHSGMWAPIVKHMKPDVDLAFKNGKVNGVITGIRAAGHPKVVIADDDIRYEVAALTRVCGLLDGHELVIAHSFFAPVSWNALWDTSRILLNRAFAVHFPATMGIDRELFLRLGGYDGDVLFENLELIRTMREGGATVASPLDLFVKHLPPKSDHFWSQRVRQAYDEFAIPLRMALWLVLLPAAVGSIAMKRMRGIALALTATIFLAEVGRRRAGGTSVYPVSASALAPVWITERAVCAWVALGHRVRRGGIAYRDGLISRAATPKRELRERIVDKLSELRPVR